MWICHRKEILKPIFLASALRQSESRNCGLRVGCIQKDGATLMVGTWQREKHNNKLIEWKAFVANVTNKGADLKDKFLFYNFVAFRLSVFEPKAMDNHNKGKYCKHGM